MLGMSVARAMEEISASEFQEWVYFLERDPDPDVKRQHEAASICREIASAFTRGHPRLEDFILSYKPRRRMQRASQAHIKAGFRQSFRGRLRNQGTG